MADKEIDKKSEQGVSGFLKRNFGTGTEVSYAEIYSHERERARYRASMSTGERTMFGLLAGSAASLVGLLGGFALDEFALSPQSGIDTNFIAQLEPQNTGHYIGVNYGRDTYALSIGDGGRPLVWQLNHEDELVLQESAGDALEDVAAAIFGLERSIAVMGRTSERGDPMANIVSFQNVSDMHIEGANIERQAQGVQAFSPSDQLTYRQTLEKVLPAWQAAQQTITNDFYGFTNDQRTQIKGYNYDGGGVLISAAALSFVFTFLGFVGSPHISAGAKTLGRARRGRKQARAMKKR